MTVTFGYSRSSGTTVGRVLAIAITVADIPLLTTPVRAQTTQASTRSVVAVRVEACRAGDDRACVEAGGRLLRAPDHVRRNRDVAHEMFTSACGLGNMDGCAALIDHRSLLLVSDDEGLRFASLIREACERGDGRACDALARSPFTLLDLDLRSSFGRALDDDDAYPFDGSHPLERERRAYSLQCDAGLATACASLGYVLETGRGVEARAGRARRFFERACVLGLADGCMEAADRVTSADRSRAVSLLAHACRLGLPNGCEDASMLFRWGGVGVMRDVRRAESLHARAEALWRAQWHRWRAAASRDGDAP